MVNFRIAVGITVLSILLLVSSAAAAGDVWTWGNNNYGQLGDGTNTSSLTPVSVSGISNIIAIAGGYSHTIALNLDGTVWTWGNNSNGQLGDGTNTNRLTPVSASGISNVITIADGAYHTIALKLDGTVWTWGANIQGQLGDGTNISKSFPVHVSGISNVTAIAGGFLHSIALKSDGTVWTWGYNAFGQLGDGTYIDKLTPVMSNISNVTAIASGYSHNVALKSDGTVWTWGYNTDGELGDGTNISKSIPFPVSGISNVTAIASGDFHTIALKSDGTVWTWGANLYGQLGDGTNIGKSIPVQVMGISNVTAIAGGYLHTIALKSDGTVWTWGANSYGQLGDGTEASKSTPVQVSGISNAIVIAGGSFHTIILKETSPSVYIPPDPINFISTQGNFWINHTWQPDFLGNITDSYNVSVNDAWINSTETYNNITAVPSHGWSNITVWAYNNSGNGALSLSSVSIKTQLSNNIPVQSHIGNLKIKAGDVLNITVSTTDADNDTIIYGTNASNDELNNLTGKYSWSTTYLDAGDYAWYFNSSDSYGGVASETITISIVLPSGPPNITSFTPSSNVTTEKGSAQTFSIDINQSVDVTWRLDGNVVKDTEKNVITANYTNPGSSEGIWNVTVDVSNSNGSDSRSWTWTVHPPIAIIDISPENNSENRNGTVNVKVTLNRPGTVSLIWNEIDEYMEGGGTFYYRNKTGLLSGNYSFRVYAVDSIGNSDTSETRIIIINRSRDIPLPIDSITGNVSLDFQENAPSDNVTLKISNNTNANVELISIDSHAYIEPEIRAVMEIDNKFAGEILELGPAGATFNPDVQMIFNYTNEQLNQSGITDESKLTISYYNSSAPKWENLKITERNATRNYLIGSTSHFSLFALAADLTPPPGVTDLKNTSFGRDYINWTWTDPIDASFDHTSIRIDGVFKGNVSKGVQFYNATGFEPDTSHTINVTTVDAYGNSNQTAVTNTSRTATSPSIYITIITPENNSENTTGSITIKVKLDRNGIAKLNWKGEYELMDGSGMNFSSNKTGVLSGNFSFRVYANDSTTTAVSETRNIRVNRTIESKFLIGESGNTTGDYSITLPSNNTTVTLYNGTNISIVNKTGQLIDCGSEKNISVDSLDKFSYEISSRLIKNRFAGENFTVEPVCARNMSGVHIRFIPDAQIRINYTDAELAALHVTVNDFMVKYYDEINQTWSNLNITYRGDTYIIVNVSYLCSIAKVVPTVAQMLVMQAGSSTVEPGTQGVVSAEPADNIIDYEIHGNNLVADKSIIYKYVKGEKGIYEIAAMSNKNESNVLIRVEYLKNLSKKVNEQAPEILHYYTNIWSGSTNIKESVIRFKEENSWIDSNKLTRVKMLRFDGGKWTDPGTKQISKDEKYTYFETKSNGFSSFAIIGVKPEPTPGETEVVAPSPSILVTSSTKDVKPPNWDIILLVLAVVLIIAILVVGIPALKAKPIQIKSIPTEPFMAKQPAEYGEKYNEHLFEQYKQYVDMVDKLNQRQRSNDTGYLIIASLFGVLSGLESLAKQQIWPFLVPFTGLLISIKWLTFTYKYRQLNLAKLNIIYELESQLPAALYASEWKNAREGKTRSYLAIEFIEQVVPWIFAGIFFIYIIVRLNQM